MTRNDWNSVLTGALVVAAIAFALALLVVMATRCPAQTVLYYQKTIRAGNTSTTYETVYDGSEYTSVRTSTTVYPVRTLRRQGWWWSGAMNGTIFTRREVLHVPAVPSRHTCDQFPGPAVVAPTVGISYVGWARSGGVVPGAHPFPEVW